MSEANRHLRAEFYKDGHKDMVFIQVAGDTLNAVRTKVTPELAMQFPKEWEAFQLGQEVAEPIGTPLTAIPGFTPEMARFYRMANIHTCEQLATVPDVTAQKLGIDARKFRDLARIIVENNDLKEQRKQHVREALAEIDEEPEPTQLDRIDNEEVEEEAETPRRRSRSRKRK